MALLLAKACAPLLDAIPEGTTRIAIGVSGGADSFALLHMMQERNANLIALTVDHQLRPESANEAKTVADWCNANGIEHHILIWSDDKPTSALQDTARHARRRLLCDFCKAHAIPVLLLGHQADDQAETLVMRLQRGSGLQGLAGIPVTATDPATHVKIIRPLLGVSRQFLRDYATAHKLPFVDDPSNDNPAFERPRTRQALSALPQLAHGTPLSVTRLRRAHDALDQLTAEWQARHAQQLDDGVWLPREPWLAQPEELRLRIVGHYTGAETPLDGLEHLVTAMVENDFAGQTLAESWIRPKVLEKQPGFLIQKAPKRHL